MAARGRDELPPVRKSLGQHFLSDRRILGRIVDALSPREYERIIEIGPGRGTLTDLLIERAGGGRVVAIEYDRALAARLSERYASQPNVRIVQADVLETDLGALAEGEPYALVGNVPYYITTPIVFHALQRPRPERAVYLVQREVADRMAASPGSKEYGALSVNLQALTAVEVLFRVSAGAFTPPPKVESAVVRITPKCQAVVAPEEEQPLRDLVQALFGLRRKQMRRALREIRPMTGERADGMLTAAGIEPEARPETLSPEQFAALLRLLRDD